MRARESPNVPEELSTKESIVFFAPRIHDNQRGWVSALREIGVDVAYLVFGHTRNAEILGTQPIQVPQSRFSALFRHLQRQSDYDTEEDFLRATYLPSFSWLLRFFFLQKPSVVVSRDRTRASFVALSAATLAGVRKIFLYVQEPLGEPISSQKSSVQDWCFDVARKNVQKNLWPGRIEALTPLISPNLLSVIDDESNWSDSFGRHFLPFCLPVAKLERPSNHDGPLRVIILSKFRTYKNLFLLPRALRQVSLAKRRRFEFVFAGAAHTEQDYELSRKLEEELSKLSGVRFSIKTNLPYEEAKKLLRESAVLVLPSESDLAPIAPLEAMASGVVPIVSRNSGTACFVQNGVSGFVFEPSDFDRLAALLERVTDDRQELQNLRSAAQETAERVLSPDTFRRAFRRAVAL